MLLHPKDQRYTTGKSKLANVAANTKKTQFHELYFMFKSYYEEAEFHVIVTFPDFEMYERKKSQMKPYSVLKRQFSVELKSKELLEHESARLLGPLAPISGANKQARLLAQRRSLAQMIRAMKSARMPGRENYVKNNITSCVSCSSAEFRDKRVQAIKSNS